VLLVAAADDRQSTGCLRKKQRKLCMNYALIRIVTSIYGKAELNRLISFIYLFYLFIYLFIYYENRVQSTRNNKVYSLGQNCTSYVFLPTLTLTFAP